MESQEQEEGEPVIATTEQPREAVPGDDSVTPVADADAAAPDQPEAETGVVDAGSVAEVAQSEDVACLVGEHSGDDAGRSEDESDDSCSVCLCLLCEPVTLGCGHTFWCARFAVSWRVCLSAPAPCVALTLRCCCLARSRLCAFKALHSQASGATCPLCRSPHAAPQKPSDLPLAQSQADSIAARYPAQLLKERADAASAEWAAFEEALKSRRELLFFIMRSPSFGVGSASALHLFEPRYCWLAARALEENEGRFGFVTSGQGSPGGRGVCTHAASCISCIYNMSRCTSLSLRPAMRHLRHAISVSA